jgi:hypothetical protein
MICFFRVTFSVLPCHICTASVLKVAWSLRTSMFEYTVLLPGDGMLQDLLLTIKYTTRRVIC